MFHNCFKVDSSMFCVCFQGCLNNFTGVSWMFQGCFKSKCVLKKLQGIGIGEKVSKVFQGSFKFVSGIFQKCVKSVSK